MQKSNLLMYTTEDGLTKIEATFVNDTVWLSIEQMAELFQRDRSVIGKHIRNIFKEGELKKESVWAKFAHTAGDGKTYQVDYYNLDVIISVGYRVKSLRGTQFRIWATDILKEYMGLTSWQGKSIKRTDVEVAKNYLNKDELDALNKIVTAYLDIAEVHALNHEPMYMKDWLVTIDDYLKMTRRDILRTKGTVTHKQALEKAHEEYEKYKKREESRLSLVEQHFLDSINELEGLEEKS